MEESKKENQQAFVIHGVMQSAFAVIPDAERYLGGTNEVIAVFKHREQAERFAKALWKEYYIIEEVQSPHFANLEIDPTPIHPQLGGIERNKQ